MNQTNHFFDLGYGWQCKHCSAADAEARQHPKSSTDQKSTMPNMLALASWTDESRKALFCPRCGIHEQIR
jgi:hypothetical protein